MSNWKTLLNTPAEVHSLVHGVYAGLTEWKGADLPNDPEIQDEAHYWKAGYVAGTVLRWVGLVCVGAAYVV